jgi:hypothetical protein
MAKPRHRTGDPGARQTGGGTEILIIGIVWGTFLAFYLNIVVLQ